MPQSVASPVSGPAAAIPSSTSAPPSRPARRLGPRAALPGGRAIVGGLLVTVAAVGTFAAHASSTSGPTHRYVVVRAGVRAGQRLREEDLRTIAVDLPDDLASRSFATTAELDGAIALTALEPDEIVLRSAVEPPSHDGTGGAPRHELSFAVEREHAVNGDLQRGELVDLVATYGTGSDAYTEFVARRVPVIDLDAGAKSSLGSAGRVTITIALDGEAAVLEATHALESAKVTIVRATRADPGAAPGPDRYPAKDTRSVPAAPGTTATPSTTSTTRPPPTTAAPPAGAAALPPDEPTDGASS